MSQAPAAARDAGLDGDPAVRGLAGVAVVISPLRRSRTEPSRSGSTQPKQMPIRQPARHQHAGLLGGVEDRRARRRPSPSVPGRGEGDGAALADRPIRSVRKLLGEQRSAPRPLVVLLAARRAVPTGPHAERRSARPGRGPVGARSSTSSTGRARRCSRLDQPDQPGGVELPQVGQEDRVGRGGRDVQDDERHRAPSGRAGRRPRRTPGTGCAACRSPG